MFGDRIRISENFFLDEYIDKDTYEYYYRRSKLHRLAWKIDKELVQADQLLRDKFGPVTINNWWNGGDRNWSGIRIEGSPYYSKDSSHSSGHASDKIFQNVSAQEVQHYIMKQWKWLGITELELGVNWVHSGTRFIPYQKELMTYYPTK